MGGRGEWYRAFAAAGVADVDDFLGRSVSGYVRWRGRGNLQLCSPRVATWWYLCGGSEDGDDEEEEEEGREGSAVWRERGGALRVLCLELEAVLVLVTRYAVEILDVLGETPQGFRLCKATTW